MLKIQLYHFGAISALTDRTISLVFICADLQREISAAGENQFLPSGRRQSWIVRREEVNYFVAPLPPSPHFLFVAKVGETIICLRIVYWRKAILRWAFLSVSIFVYLNCEILTSNHALQFNLESVWTERQIPSLPLFP